LQKSRRKERHDSLKKEEPEGIELKPIPPPDDSDEEDIQRDISGTVVSRIEERLVTRADCLAGRHAAIQA
jgi:hypothetical protein